MRIDRFSHRVDALLQPAGGFTRPRSLRIQAEHAINGRTRVHRDLPFLPGNIQIHGAEILASGSLLRQKRNQRTKFPARIESVSGPRPKSIAAGDVVGS
jgi:hypothetical protein